MVTHTVSKTLTRARARVDRLVWPTQILSRKFKILQRKILDHAKLHAWKSWRVKS